MSDNNTPPLPQQPKQMTPLAEMPKFVGLTNAKAFEIAGALANLEDLKTAKPSLVVPGQPSDEDKAKAVIEYLADELIAHGGELLGCFFVVKGEYNPLLQALKPVAQRVFSQLQQDKQNAAAARQAERRGEIELKRHE